jgi:hypothetical protein
MNEHVKQAFNALIVQLDQDNAAYSAQIIASRLRSIGFRMSDEEAQRYWQPQLQQHRKGKGGKR